MNAYIFLMVDFTVWHVSAESVDDALEQFRRDMPRQRGRHRGVYLQVVPPHRLDTKDGES
jgi:hypothetical protein